MGGNNSTPKENPPPSPSPPSTVSGGSRERQLRHPEVGIHHTDLPDKCPGVDTCGDEASWDDVIRIYVDRRNTTSYRGLAYSNTYDNYKHCAGMAKLESIGFTENQIRRGIERARNNRPAGFHNVRVTEIANDILNQECGSSEVTPKARSKARSLDMSYMTHQTQLKSDPGKTTLTTKRLSNPYSAADNSKPRAESASSEISTDNHSKYGSPNGLKMKEPPSDQSALLEFDTPDVSDSDKIRKTTTNNLSHITSRKILTDPSASTDTSKIISESSSRVLISSKANPDEFASIRPNMTALGSSASALSSKVSSDPYAVKSSNIISNWNNYVSSDRSASDTSKVSTPSDSSAFEKSRASTSSDWRTSETSRASAPTDWSTSEKSRASAPTNWSTSEKSRASAPTDWSTYEKSRVIVPMDWSTPETSRVSASTDWNTSEKSRVSALSYWGVPETCTASATSNKTSQEQSSSGRSNVSSDLSAPLKSMKITSHSSIASKENSKFSTSAQHIQHKSVSMRQKTVTLESSNSTMSCRSPIDTTFSNMTGKSESVSSVRPKSAMPLSSKYDSVGSGKSSPNLSASLKTKMITSDKSSVILFENVSEPSNSVKYNTVESDIPISAKSTKIKSHKKEAEVTESEKSNNVMSDKHHSGMSKDKVSEKSVSVGCSKIKTDMPVSAKSKYAMPSKKESNLSASVKINPDVLSFSIPTGRISKTSTKCREVKSDLLGSAESISARPSKTKSEEQYTKRSSMQFSDISCDKICEISASVKCDEKKYDTTKSTPNTEALGPFISKLSSKEALSMKSTAVKTDQGVAVDQRSNQKVPVPLCSRMSSTVTSDPLPVSDPSITGSDPVVSAKPKLMPPDRCNTLSPNFASTNNMKCDQASVYGQRVPSETAPKFASHRNKNDQIQKLPPNDVLVSNSTVSSIRYDTSPSDQRKKNELECITSKGCLSPTDRQWASTSPSGALGTVQPDKTDSSFNKKNPGMKSSADKKELPIEIRDVKMDRADLTDSKRCDGGQAFIDDVLGKSDSKLSIKSNKHIEDSQIANGNKSDSNRKVVQKTAGKPHRTHEKKNDGRGRRYREESVTELVGDSVKLADDFKRKATNKMTSNQKTKESCWNDEKFVDKSMPVDVGKADGKPLKSTADQSIETKVPQGDTPLPMTSQGAFSSDQSSRHDIREIEKSSKKKQTETMLFLKLKIRIEDEGELLPHLINVISDVHFAIQKFTYSISEKTTEVAVNFPSSSMADKFSHQLKSKRKEFGIDFTITKSKRNRRDREYIENQLLYFVETAIELMKKHEKKLEEKRNLIKGLAEGKRKKKFMTLSAFEDIQGQKEALSCKVREYENQKKEFQLSLNLITSRLEAVKNNAVKQKEFDCIKTDFDIECSRIQDPLPMYAMRSKIIDMVKCNQVSVILGETGSGKSTQLTQYIYQSGVADGKLIVCTQPRKVAAISLGTRVASEMKVGVGHLVGYHVGMKSKRNNDTKIVYMTDHLLLNECLEDNLLQRYGCVIIDEAHERSIYTDLLIGMIKSILPQREDLRVIVTSATIDPKVFVDYFDGCPVMHVSGRMFPVEIVWGPNEFGTVTDDYENQAVKMALEIHKNELEGDILVFLTSQVEIERSIGKLEALLRGRRDAIILPLHGKLQADEQNRVFMKTPRGKRKIVLATNVAETSLTIPGIKYVVDTGVAKEMTYDPRRKISSLDVKEITKSSADQRKGRAGRTDVGKCFRLYSQETYELMRPIAMPEILKTNLGHAILKLLQLDVNPLEFDFVESPSEDSLTAAYESLEQLGGVLQGSITDKGKWIAKLPLSPNLGSLVYDAMQDNEGEEGIGIEGVTLAACCTSGGSLFYRAGTVQEKRESDKLKVPFCHGSGDHLTYLNVFKQWHKVDEKKKGKWCRDHSVNGKAMRGIRETVNEILQVLKKEMDIILHFTLEDGNSHESKLQTYIFRAFMANVCYYLGHQKAGYHFIDKDQQVVMHPSSSFESLGELPEWVVIEQVMRTSRDFAVNVTSVKEDDIMDAILKGWLKFDLDSVKARRVEPVCVEFVGSQLHREFVGPRYGKVKEMEQCLTSEQNDIFVVDADRNKGQITIFTTREHKEISQTTLSESVNPLRKKIVSQMVDIPLTPQRDSILVTIGPGGCTFGISSPDEYRSVHVYANQSDSISEEDVLRYLSKYGEIQNAFTKSPNNKNPRYWGKVNFKSTSSASDAVGNTKYGDKMWVKPNTSCQIESNTFRAKISWCRRLGRGFGFVQIHDASILNYLYNLRKIRVGNDLATVRASKRNEDEVHIAGFNSLVDEGVLRESVLDALQGTNAVDDDIGRVNIAREKANDSKDMMDTFERRIRAEVGIYVENRTFRVNLLEPKGGEFHYRGFIMFNDPQAGNKACQAMDHVFSMNGRVISMVPELQASIFVGSRIHTRVAQLLDITIQEILDRDTNVDITCKSNRTNDVFVNIHSSSVEGLTRAKRKLENVVKGDTLEFDYKAFGRILYSHRGRANMTTIMQKTDTDISVDERNLVIVVHGTPEKRRRGSEEMRKYLDGIRHSYCEVVELRGRDKPAGYMKALIVKYGASLEQLREEFQLHSVDLIHHLHRLTLLGEEENVQRCMAQIRSMEEGLFATMGTEKSPGCDCGVCFCEIEENEMYRLEACGHPFCVGCVERQVESSTQSREFPLKCSVDGCNTDWTWQDIIAMIKRGVVTKGTVMHASVAHFVSQNKATYKYCLTPDCPVVYKVRKQGDKFKCPVCDLRICTNCHVEYHDGLTCTMYQLGNGKDENELLVWMAKDERNRKQCPKCSEIIEKNGGCQHMTCPTCNTHICWICMATFSNGRECYGHMNKVHHTFV